MGNSVSLLYYSLGEFESNPVSKSSSSDETLCMCSLKKQLDLSFYTPVLYVIVTDTDVCMHICPFPMLFHSLSNVQ